MFKSSILFEKTIRILKELERRLDGECSNSHATCPYKIENNLFWKSSPLWTCHDCVFIFKDIVDLNYLCQLRYESLKNEYDNITIKPCPCILSKHFSQQLPQEVVISRLLEHIEELESKRTILSKFYGHVYTLQYKFQHL
jgi:hypothetical protein